MSEQHTPRPDQGATPRDDSASPANPSEWPERLSAIVHDQKRHAKWVHTFRTAREDGLALFDATDQADHEADSWMPHPGDRVRIWPGGPHVHVVDTINTDGMVSFVGGGFANIGDVVPNVGVS